MFKTIRNLRTQDKIVLCTFVTSLVVSLDLFFRGILWRSVNSWDWDLFWEDSSAMHNMVADFSFAQQLLLFIYEITPFILVLFIVYMIFFGFKQVKDKELKRFVEMKITESRLHRLLDSLKRLLEMAKKAGIDVKGEEEEYEEYESWGWIEPDIDEESE